MRTANYPVAPTVTGLEGTLLDAADVETGIEWLDGLDMMESYNCMTFGATAEFCAANSKTFPNTVTWNDGFRFVAYGGVQCKPVGMDISEFEAGVKRTFELGESTAIERAFLDLRFQAFTDRWAAPVNITPASGAVKPGVAVAMLEGYASTVYVGAPTIHMPRTIASMLLGVDGAMMDGGVIRSKLGSKIAAGAGYAYQDADGDLVNTGPDGVESTPGELWVYATGEVVLRGGEATHRGAFDQTNNDYFVLAERAYIGVADCFAAAIRVKVE